MDKLNNDFIDAIVKEYEDKRFVNNDIDDVSVKESMILQAKDSAYVFALCINKLIDDGYFK